MHDRFSRWPLLIGANVCLAAAIALFTAVQTPEGKVLAAIGLVVLGSALLGAFIYSEGATSKRNAAGLPPDTLPAMPAPVREAGGLARFFTPPPAPWSSPTPPQTGPDNYAQQYAGPPLDAAEVWRRD